MKKSFFILLTALLTCCLELYSQPVNIEVFPDQVLEKSYLGNGVQWSAYPLMDISEKSWQRVFERTDFMKLNFIRLMVFTTDYCQSYPVGGKPVYKFDSDQIERVCRILDYCQKQGVDVLLGEWGPRMDGMSRTDPRWTEIVGELINYLVNEKEYSCIKYYNLGNEPNGRDGYVELWKIGSSVNFDNWSTSIMNLHAELVKRGLREKIKIVGPDAAHGNDWIKKIIDDKELAAAIDVYEIHTYARDRYIEEGALGKELAYYRDYISYMDPNGKSKQFFMGEAGMITGRNNVDQQKNIATFQYGVWMIDYVIQSMNAGQAGLIAWDLDDAMHCFRDRMAPGDDIKNSTWKEWGFWDSFGEEKGSPELTNMRPWFYTWSLLSKYVPRGSQVLKSSESGIPGLRSTASKITVNGKTEYTFVFVNESTEKRAVNLVLAGVKGIDLNQFNYFENDMPVDAKGFAVAKKVVKKANLSRGIPIEMPSKGVVILTSLK